MPRSGATRTTGTAWAEAHLTGLARRPVTRVLLVDDNHEMRFLYRVLIERTGRYSVVGEAADGQAALRLAAEHEPDVVLLDVSMPVMDGFETIGPLRMICPNALVVVLTGLASAGLADKAFRLGAHGILSKDMDGAAFVKALASLENRETAHHRIAQGGQ